MAVRLASLQSCSDGIRSAATSSMPESGQVLQNPKNLNSKSQKLWTPHSYSAEHHDDLPSGRRSIFESMLSSRERCIPRRTRSNWFRHISCAASTAAFTCAAIRVDAISSTARASPRDKATKMMARHGTTRALREGTIVARVRESAPAGAGGED